MKHVFAIIALLGAIGFAVVAVYAQIHGLPVNGAAVAAFVLGAIACAAIGVE